MNQRFVPALLGALAAILVAVPAAAQDRPNILIIWGDDIGSFNVSAYNMGMMGYETPNIDRIADEGMIFTDSYGEQSCTAGPPGRGSWAAARRRHDRRAAQATRLRHGPVREEPPGRPG